MAIMKKGFMLLETLVVSMFVMGVLIFLYVQYNTISTNYEKNLAYNNTNDMYALNTIRAYLLQENLNKLKLELFNAESNYIVIYKDSCVDVNIENKEYCEQLFNKLNVKTLLLTKENLKNLINELDNDIANKTLAKELNHNFVNYIKTIRYDGEVQNHRLIAEFTNGSYASLKLLADDDAKE